jgi:hypothetical protein
MSQLRVFLATLPSSRTTLQELSTLLPSQPLSSSTLRIPAATSRAQSLLLLTAMASVSPSAWTSATSPPAVGRSVCDFRDISTLIYTNNLPAYHLHAFPVSADGNCTNTLAHLDPYERGEVSIFTAISNEAALTSDLQTPVCDSKLPQTCQVGDLSGKHGKINTTEVGDHYTANYVDNYPSTFPGLGSFFGNRSIVIHFANKTRITCANFTMAGTSVGGTGPNATYSASPTASTPAQFTGDGTRNAVSMLTLMTLTGLVFFC